MTPTENENVTPRLDPMRRTGGVQELRDHRYGLDAAIEPRHDEIWSYRSNDANRHAGLEPASIQKLGYKAPAHARPDSVTSFDWIAAFAAMTFQTNEE